MEIEIKKYNADLRQEWDNFVSSSKNGTFLFFRDFMEYHADRFTDSSLLFYSKNKIIALLPANIADNTLYSHQGLTYGGLILSSFVTTKVVLEIFDTLRLYIQALNINRIIYKTIPHIYHKQASEEDLYALHHSGAKLLARSISSCIIQQDRINYSELRKRGIKKAVNKALTIKESSTFVDFWEILEKNLSLRFAAAPVHTLVEISYLKSKFPDSIHLFEVYDQDTVVAGCVIFEMPRIVHVQYISASENGKTMGALDYLFNCLIKEKYADKAYFDFGISTEKNGAYLNQGLISQKEGFGARGIVYDTYELQI